LTKRPIIPTKNWYRNSFNNEISKHGETKKTNTFNRFSKKKRRIDKRDNECLNNLQFFCFVTGLCYYFVSFLFYHRLVLLYSFPLIYFQYTFFYYIRPYSIFFRWHQKGMFKLSPKKTIRTHNFANIFIIFQYEFPKKNNINAIFFFAIKKSIIMETKFVLLFVPKIWILSSFIKYKKTL